MSHKKTEFKFKIGDKVTCIDAHASGYNPLILGGIYTITQLNSSNDLKMVHVDSHTKPTDYFNQNRFKLASPEPVKINEPKDEGWGI